MAGIPGWRARSGQAGLVAVVGALSVGAPILGPPVPVGHASAGGSWPADVTPQQVAVDRGHHHAVGAGAPGITDTASLNRLEPAGESVRACLEALAAAAPGWLAGAVDVAGWAKRYPHGWTPGGCRPPRPSGPNSPRPTVGTGLSCWRRSGVPMRPPGSGAARGGGPAGGAAAELHPHGHPRGAGGDQAAGGGYRWSPA